MCVPTWESLGRQSRGRVSLGVEMNERSMVSGSLEPVIEAGVPGPSPSLVPADGLSMEGSYAAACHRARPGPGLKWAVVSSTQPM